MAAEDHLSLANQQVDAVDGLLVLLGTLEVLSIQFVQAHHEVTETSEEKLAAVHPMGSTLALRFDRITQTSVERHTVIAKNI